MNTNPIFIGEIKTQSMYGFKSIYDRHHYIDCALKHADWISVHTDPRFGGSFDDIYMLRRETNKPILAKGFHCSNDDVKKAYDLGADYVLVVHRIPLFSRKHTIIEADDSMLNTGIGKLCKGLYNGRNIRNGLPKEVNKWAEYRKEFEWLCGASLIKNREDVQKLYPGCDAFIVGFNLLEFCGEV